MSPVSPMASSARQESFLTYMPATDQSYRSSAGVVKTVFGFGRGCIQLALGGKERKCSGLLSVQLSQTRNIGPGAW